MGKKLLLLPVLFLIFLPISIWGQCPTSVSISSDTGNTICEGTAVTFTATPSNNGTESFTFQWKINGTDVNSETANTFSTSTLTNGQKISVVVTDANGSSCSVTSSNYTMTVNSNKTPTVSLSSTPSIKCIGENVTFTASNTNAGSSPSYAWYVNSSSTPSQTSSSNTFSISSLTTGANNIRVVLTSSLTCVTSSTAETTANITITDNSTISSPGNKDQPDVCINTAIDPIVFAIGGSGNGASVSGLPPGVTGNYSSGNFTISGSPSVDGSFNYTVTATGPCESATETGTISILKNATIGLTSANNQQEVCQNEDITNITYNIGETGTGASVSNLPSGISGSFSGGVYTISGSSAITGTHNFTITATGSCRNSQSLNGSITINKNLTPSVSIVSSDTDNTICEGTQVTFTATPINGGTNPSYQWKVGTTNVGANSNVFTTNALALGDQSVSVVLTSNETCLTQAIATSTSIVTTVNENLTPQVSVSPSDTDICDGDEVIFTAIPVNGGATPSYQWKVNGSNVGTNSDTFVTNSLTNGQSVTVVLTSDETCLVAPTDTSEPIITTVNSNLTPEVSITSNDTNNIICSSSSITFNASAVNGGSNPSYQWYIDGNPAGSNNAAFITSSLTNGQKVKLVMTSNEECLAATTAESNEIAIQVDQPVASTTPTFDYSNSSHNSTAICPVANGLVYRINPIPGATSYIWTFPNSGWTVTSGANSNQITVNAGTTAGPGNITVKGVSDCGQGQTASLAVTTGTLAYVNAGPDLTVCAGTTSVLLDGEVGGVINQGKDFSWSASVSGGSFSDQNGNNAEKKANPTYTIPQSIRNGGVVTITITSVSPSGTCPEPKVDQMVLTVQKNATISNPANKDQTICISNAIPEINFNITDAGTGATISGLPAGLGGTYEAGVFTISGTPTESGSFNYTVSTTGNCAGQQTSQTGTITVAPDHTISDPVNKSQEICINTAIENIVFSTNSSVTNANVSGLPAGLNGNLSSGNYTISGTATEAGSFEYTVTTIGDCINRAQTGIITVDPDPTIDSPANNDQSLCINTTIDNIEFTITSPGTGAIVTGLPEGLDTSFSNGILTISGIPTEAGAVAGENGVFNYTVQTEGECVQTSESGTITVIPDPTATISYPDDICTSIAGSVNVTVGGTGDYAGGNFSATPQGLTISASSGAITPSSSQPGTYTVTYSGPDTCNPAVATVEVNIIAEPFVEISYKDPFCNSDSALKDPVFTNGVGNYENGTFTSSEPGGLTINPDNGKINPQTSSPGTYDVYYTISEGSGCNEVLITTEVIITQNPQINISYPETICSSETSVAATISGEDGNYQGGTYSGSAGLAISSDGTINPSESTTGAHTVTYTIATNAGCEEVTASANFIIKEIPLITTNPVNTGVCSNSPAEFQVVATGDDLLYQWYRIVDGTSESIPGENEPVLSFTNVTSADALQYYVTVTGDNACTEATSETVTLNVDEDIVITEPTEDITICEDERADITFIFKGHANGAPLTFQWIKDGETVTQDPGKIEMNVSEPSGANGEYTGTLTIIDPEAGENGDSGVYWVTVDGPDYFTCPEATSKTFTFRVDPRPEAPSVTNQQFCLEVDAGNLTAAGENGNDIKWYTLEGDTYTYIGDNITIDTSSPTTFEYYATQTRPNGCESDFSEALTIEILDTPPPVSTETIKFEYCHNEEVSESLAVTPADGAEINWYDMADAENPLAAPPLPATDVVGKTTYYVSQTFTTTTGCESDITPVEVTIKAVPNVVVDIVGEENTICLGSSIDFTATGAETYTWFLGETELQTGATTTYQATPTTLGESIYTVIGTTNGCTNSYNISVFVDDNSVAGNLDAPERICISSGTATLSLESRIGEIIKWEYNNATTADAWTETEDIDLNDSRTFTGLTETTSYRVTVKNGVCEEATSETTVMVDAIPEGGTLSWSNNERIFLTCEVQSNDLNDVITLNGETGQIIEWEYRTASNLSWTTYDSQNGTLTNSDFINILGNNVESTVFRVKIGNGACENGVYSQTAILSVIPSDIKPAPVEVTPEVVCYGNEITLSSSTGYGQEFGKFDGGDFTSAGIKKDWNFTDQNGNTVPYDANANNGNPIHWHKTQPKWKFITADINSPYNTSEMWWNPLDDGKTNEHFAIAQSTYSSNMDTPPFSLLATDEAILTFDQAFNLTTDATIRVVLLKNGAEYKELDKITGPASSGNYEGFASGTPGINDMSYDLGSYIGESNLRIRFEYRGVRLGDIWAVDNIKVPEGPQDVLLQWYYDDKDPNTTELEQIGDDNENVVSFEPRKIGWNDFEVKTALVLDSNGDPCEDINNSETIRVFVFDQYTTTVVAETGECGNTIVNLSATVEGAFQGDVTNEFVTGEFKTIDGYTGAWVIQGPNENYTLTDANPDDDIDPINNPEMIFEAEDLGDYSFSYQLTPTAVDGNGDLIENTGCPPIITPNEVTLPECTTLDFDGTNDVVVIDNVFSGVKAIEAWIRPEVAGGTIISGPSFEISTPSGVTANDRWYHIAVIYDGDDAGLYIDGIRTGNAPSGNGGGTRTSIGAKWTSADTEATDHFSGWIEEVRIWNNPPELRELRFMMNQRLKLDATGTVTSPLEGEVVPNRSLAGSYLTDGNDNNLHLEGDGTLKPFYDQSSADLAGYYRLYSAIPDPDGLQTFDDALKPQNGMTPDLALNAVDGRLHNMTTHQQNTSPTPYFDNTTQDGQNWETDNTWARPDVWDPPNSNNIEWNIARINTNINSGNKNITMLGLLSETQGKELSINSDHPIRISHYLLLDGNMDLEGESQLLQDHGSILANSSAGWLEVNQKGRMSSYNYNYWTSPVSIQGAANNSGFMLNQVLFDGDIENGPEPVNFQNGYYVADKPKTSPIIISNEWLWDFRGGDADIYGDWLHLGSDFLEIVGAGYSMKGTDGAVAINTEKQNYSFRGKPNNGNIPTNELYLLNNQNYLVGNPYPSAIDAYEFLLDNLPNDKIYTIPGTNNKVSGRRTPGDQPFNGTLYYWDHFSGKTHILEEYIGGYAYFSFGGETPAYSSDWRIENSNPGMTSGKLAKRFIPVAQGFFLNSSGGDFAGDIVFKNTQRVYKRVSTDPSIFLQQEEELVKGKEQKGRSASSDEDLRMKIRLKFESPKGYHRQILVTRDENTSNGFDIGYDAPLIENNVEDMYWWFDDNGFVIQGVPDFEKEQILPLVIKTKEGGEFKIKIDKTENWPTAKELYLHDKMNDTIHDIIKEDYIAKTEAGEIKDRFELVFFKETAQDPDPVIPDPDEVIDPDELPYIDGLVGISYSTFSKQVKISNFDLLDVSKVMIFDMGGKLIQQYDDLPTEREILLGMRPVRSGVYIIKVFSENGISDKKVVIK